jgi:hypothetical protein
VIGAFLYLQSRSFANRMLARLKRLKRPKYLVGAIVGGLYFYFYFFQYAFLGGHKHARPDFAVDTGMFELIAATVLCVVALSAWIFPHARTALIFSEAEIAFLFPAPVSRRTLIHFKLLRSQIAILFTTLLLTLITGRMFTGTHAWIRVLGWWVVLSTLNLHFLASSFARTMLLDRGISNWLRRSLVILTLGALIAVSIFWARRNITPPPLDDLSNWKAFRDYGKALFATPPISYLLLPFQFVVRPYLAADALSFVKALGPALLIIGAHYWWVIRSNVAFEEASVEVSRRIAERVAAARQGKGLDTAPKKGHCAPFPLAATGFTPLALFWKNLIAAQTLLRPRTLLVVLLPFTIVAFAFGSQRHAAGWLAPMMTIMALMFLVWSLLIGAQMVRCDIRQDLAAMDVIKMFPLRGWQIVLGELLAPAVILTCIQGLLVAIVLALSGNFAREIRLPFEARTGWAAAILVLLPFWNGVSLLIPNATMLLFPGWFQTRADAPQGIEVMGQRLVLLFGQLLVICVALIPAGIAFAFGYFAVKFLGAISLAPLIGALGAAVVLTGEIALGIFLLGKLFEKFDLSAEAPT